MNNLHEKKSHRSNLLHKNIAASIILQVASIFLGFLLLPISLKYVSTDQYGVWVTINSTLLWFSYLDFGLGTGLKNKLGESLAKNDIEQSKSYISTAYFVIFSIMAISSFFYKIASPYINFSSIFHLDQEYSKLVNSTIDVVIYLFFLRFILQIINTIVESMQKIYIAKLLNSLSQFFVLITVYLLTFFTKGNILILGIVVSAWPVLVLLLATIIFFIINQDIKPSIRNIKMSIVKDIYNIGVRFFLIQICMLVLFQTSNILIIQNFGPKEVVKYNVAFSLFSMINVGFSTISAPYWSAYTNAWTLKDLEWIRSSNKNLKRIWLAIVIVALPVLLFSNNIYLLWTGKDLEIPFSLSVILYLYFCIFSFSGIYNMFINSTGKIYLQFISLGISAVIFIPLIYLFTNFLNLGLLSFPLALLTISAYTLVIAPIQYNAIINGTAKGIWDK